ncbi:MAG: TolC family protein [Verrucomicrobiae bacterium]|nr:TolC family protein [Verrucomicrobiae bacterium]
MKSIRWLILLATLVFAFQIGAQETNYVQRSISLEECIEMALKHNLDIQIMKLNPEIQRSILEFSKGVYDPVIKLGYNRTMETDPGNIKDFFGTPVREDRTRNHFDNVYTSVEGKLPSGTMYSIPLEFNRSFGGTLPFDTYNGTIGIELRHPLLKNSSIDSERLAILVNKKNIKVSEFSLRYQVMTVVSTVEIAYYDLIFARENVKVMEKALELAEQLYKDNMAKVKAGVLLPLDEKQAESEISMRKSDLLRAWHLVYTTENLLKNLMTDDLEQWKNVRLIPTAPLIAVPQKFDLQESWRTGLSLRPDLAQLKTGVEINDLNIRFYKNQKLPDVSLVGRYGSSAIHTGAESMFADTWSQRNPDYIYGIEVVFPWSNKQTKAKLRESRQLREQSELQVKKLEQDIMVQIQDAISLAKTSFDRIDATRRARIFAEAALENEIKKLQNGKSTSFFVLQFQRDLIAARVAEIQALVDYNKALTTIATAEGSILDKLKIKLDFE